LRDCQEAIANSLVYKINKNISTLSPTSDDYERELEEIIKNKTSNQNPENPRQPNLSPELINFLKYLAKFNGTGN
jgi:non-homologous end joining protein Ku